MKNCFIILFISVLFSSSVAGIINVPGDQSTIQTGIDLAIDGDTVLVAPGIYMESINFLGKEIVVMSIMGMDSTVIQGDGIQRVVTFESGESPRTMLIGFTIEYGNGGIICENYSSPVIWRCKIRNNIETQGTGFNSGGGGIACYWSSPLILNSIIYGNETSGTGGGIYANYSLFKLFNSVVYGNKASSQSYSGIIFLPGAGSPLMLNSVVWENEIFRIYYDESMYEIYYCDIEGGLTGAGNINQLPQFVDPGNGDFHLQQTSPCINSGHPMIFFNDEDGSRNDMGAYGGNGFAFEALRVNMGKVVIQSVHEYPFHVYNLRNKPLTISKLFFENGNTFSSPATLPIDIPGFSIYEIPLVFEPAAAGIDSSVLTIHFADSVYTDSIQIKLQGEGGSDDASSEYRRLGILDAGLVRTIFINWGEIAHWPDAPSGEWPKGTGHQYLDGAAFIIQAETQDISGNTIHPMETQYREFVDRGPSDELWGLLPLPGYFHPFSDMPAISTLSESWPSQWPNKPPEWGGYWNGFYGRGVTAADQETYFVMDDSQDQEWPFYPLASDSSRGGLGLVIEGRGYAWADSLLEDILVWHYTIKNISDYDYHKVVLGLYIDTGIGGTTDYEDDSGVYLPDQKMVYFRDADGYGSPGNWSPVGVLGFKYLEMPGNPYDGIDNDGDGLTDESRDNGIDDDGDWDSLTDDVGMDGLAGTGDSGESDGIPTSGEPNFDKTDPDESDELTINTVKFFPVHTYELWDEEENWQVFNSGVIDPDIIVTNLGSFIISEQFPLYSGETTYFSFAMIFGENFNDLINNAGNITTTIRQNDNKVNLPKTAYLFQNYPNPFNPATSIKFSLPKAGYVTLKIYNILGEAVETLVSKKLNAGTHWYSWNAQNLASGLYFYRLEASNFVETKKLILLK